MEKKSFKLARETSSPHKRAALGLISGICNTANFDPTLVRFVFLLTVVFGGVPIGLYLLLWLFAFVLFGYDEQV